MDKIKMNRGPHGRRRTNTKTPVLNRGIKSWYARNRAHLALKEREKKS